MTCPDCGEKMESESMEGVSMKGERDSWGVQYFCPRDAGYWFWNKKHGLLRMGSNTGPGNTLERYSLMETDENGQVW